MTRDDLAGAGPLGPEWERRLSAYLDDEMSPSEAREFLAWLEARPDALRAAEEHRRVWSLLSAYRDEPVPEGFAERVLGRVGAPAAGAAPVLRLVRRWRALAVAAGVLAVAGAGLALRGLPTSGGPSADAPTALAALETVPESLLEGDAISRLATISDDEFEALLAADPQDLPADAPRTGSRGG